MLAVGELGKLVQLATQRPGLAFGGARRCHHAAVDVVVDLFFISDIIINFRTAYHKDDGELQLDTRAIALSYARSWFVLDLVASVPIDWFLPNSAGIGVAKIPRLLRLFRLMKKFDKLASARALRVVNLLMLFLLFAHWIACLWWIIGFHAGPLGWPYAPHVATILLGSFLLFLVQPLVARLALPQLGGAPAVWNSAMLVYQALLLGGYAYAHFLSRLAVRRQALVHLALMGLALLSLPIALADVPQPSGWEVFWVPWLLVATIGPLFFLGISAG